MTFLANISAMSSYEHITMSRLIELAKWDGVDPVELVALAYDVDYDRAMGLSDRLPANAMDWYFAEGGIWTRLNKEKRPKHLDIAGQKVRVPDDLKMEVFGKKLMVNNLLQRIDLSENKELEIVQLIPMAVAIYLVDKVEGRFSSEAIYPLVEQIQGMPARLVYPVGMFFFRQLESLTTMKSSDSQLHRSFAHQAVTRLREWLKRSDTKDLNASAI